MAGSRQAPADHATITTTSHDTALCIIPPAHLWPSPDRLRALYDKAYQKWPPHLNLVYPFVAVEDLARASELISSHVRSQKPQWTQAPARLSLNAADLFPKRDGSTIFLYDDDEEHISTFEAIRRSVLHALGQKPNNYRMHMTVAQTEDPDGSWHKFMMHKAACVPGIDWEVAELCVLVRERTQVDSSPSSRMKLWGKLNLRDLSVSRLPTPAAFYDEETRKTAAAGSEEAVAEDGTLSHRPYVFSSDHQRWQIHPAKSEERLPCPSVLKISSYNVLAEFHWPPSHARYPTLAKNILSDSGSSDVLVLQEVTDDFLACLLQNENIREQYPFVSNGPPSQPDLEPLPSHLNVVVLSKWSFSWNSVSFKRRHKGALVLQFDDIGKEHEGSFKPAILVAVHLTCGLTDGAVAAKKTELQAVVNHLSKNYAENPCILAGDFNITTSSFTIDAALRKNSVSGQTSRYLEHLEEILTEAGYSDSWAAARVHNLDSTNGLRDGQEYFDASFEGEEGATFDPTVNDLAAEIVGSGLNNRPQRYDRILIKGPELFTVGGFNLFGLEKGSTVEPSNAIEVPRPFFGSDHWGVRCALKLNSGDADMSPVDQEKLRVPVVAKTAPESLSESSKLRDYLSSRNVIPSEEETAKRAEVLHLLRKTLTDGEAGGTASSSRLKVTFVVVPVGSYGLGVWMPSSDMDCLCIGSISSRTFFSLAIQRLRRAESQGIRILRRVNANSGTMLELEVGGVKTDLQYCPSGLIAETWPQALSLPSSHPAFTLPTQTLAKLKPLRDLHYIRHTQTDFSAFKTSYQTIKTWAKSRGIYAAKFGYLAGIHISILLSRVCKLLSKDGKSTSVPNILATFFDHYASFDWKDQMVFDPFFHKRLRYVRTAREPMVILGYHAPSLNTALAASLPSVRTISEELQRANRLLSTEGMTWDRFLGDDPSRSASDFLKSYKSYVKIDVQFWGVSLAKGSQFVGWLESRCVMLLVDLNRRLPNIHARIWPARFVGKDQSDSDSDYQGCYLIGLDKLESSSERTMTKDDMKVALGSLHTVLQKFEAQIRGDEKYFDAKSSWMSTSVAKQAELGELVLDAREWGEYTVGDDEDDEEDEEEEEEDDMGSNGLESGDYETASAIKARRKKQQELADRTASPRPAYEGKFRSSADVINRLRWDPDLASSDFIVGYEDRFLGVKERALDAWKSEQTDEEFIPQHRILYFKRRGDGMVVWDRKARRDEIFGSGVRLE